MLKRPDSVLCFSGGHTDSSVPISEALSYQRALEDLCKREQSSLGETVYCERWLLEDAATDSFQNLFFSIIRFRTTYGYYPRTITVVTHAFKTERFMDLHREAISWPEESFRVIGINPCFSAREYRATLANETAHALSPFRNDPYGLRPPLSVKREQRGWNEESMRRITSDLDLEPAVLTLLQGRGIPKRGSPSLPWRL